MPRQKKTTLIKLLMDWHLSEVQRTNWCDARTLEYCTCGVDIFIGGCRNPQQMLSFLLISILIDQMMDTHFRDLYPSFRSQFKYPKLNCHPYLFFISPLEWWLDHGKFRHRTFYHDRLGQELPWLFDTPRAKATVSEIAKALFGGLCGWFRLKKRQDAIIQFQQMLKQEIVGRNNQPDGENLSAERRKQFMMLIDEAKIFNH